MKAPGDRVGRFVIERILGEGGIAQVYQARHELLDTLHALKLLPVARRGLARRLIQEGRIQAQLQHPNVVSVTDVVEERGQIGLIMEYIEGPSLEQCLRDGGAMELDEAMGLFSQICSGVAAAHLAGVLHRDLKPANVLLAASEDDVVAKVADFGIAKLASEEAAFRSGGSGPMGTPGYMAPEQITDAARADARADVFALGCILYEMLSGHRAFLGRNITELLEHTLAGRFVPLRQRVPEVPEHLEQAIVRALQVDPARRFQSVRELAQALRIEHALVAPRSLPAPEARLSATAAATDPDPRPTLPPAEEAHTFDPERQTPPPGAPTYPGELLGLDAGLPLDHEAMQDAIPTIHARNFDAAEVTWTGEAEGGDAEEFGLPGAEEVPAAADRLKARRQAWAPPGGAARAPEPRRAEPPRAEPPRAGARGVQPGRGAGPDETAEQPTLMDPRAAPPRRPGIGNLPGLNPADAIARSLAETQAPEPPPEQVKDKLDRAAFRVVWTLMRGALMVAAPLAFVAFLVIAVASFKADDIQAQQDRALELRQELADQRDRQLALAQELLDLGADPRVLGPSMEALRAAGDPAAQVQASRDLAELMRGRAQALPATTDREQELRRRELDLALNLLQEEHARYDKAVEAWAQETEGSMGTLVLRLGMADSP